MSLKQEEVTLLRNPDLATAAIHEAGHAVAHEAFADPADSLQAPWASIRLIRGPGGWSGRTAGRAKLSHTHEAIMYLTGLAAEGWVAGLVGEEAEAVILEHWLPSDGSTDGFEAMLQVRYELEAQFPEGPSPHDVPLPPPYGDLPDDQLSAFKSAIRGAIELVSGRADRVCALAQAIVERAGRCGDAAEVELTWEQAPPAPAKSPKT